MDLEQKAISKVNEIIASIENDFNYFKTPKTVLSMFIALKKMIKAKYWSTAASFIKEDLRAAKGMKIFREELNTLIVLFELLAD